MQILQKIHNVGLYALFIGTSLLRMHEATDELQTLRAIIFYNTLNPEKTSLCPYDIMRFNYTPRSLLDWENAFASKKEPLGLVADINENAANHSGDREDLDKFVKLYKQQLGNNALWNKTRTKWNRLRIEYWLSVLKTVHPDQLVESRWKKRKWAGDTQPTLINRTAPTIIGLIKKKEQELIINPKQKSIDRFSRIVQSIMPINRMKGLAFYPKFLRDVKENAAEIIKESTSLTPQEDELKEKIVSDKPFFGKNSHAKTMIGLATLTGTGAFAARAKLRHLVSSIKIPDCKKHKEKFLLLYKNTLMFLC